MGPWSSPTGGQGSSDFVFCGPVLAGQRKSNAAAAAGEAAGQLAHTNELGMPCQSMRGGGGSNSVLHPLQEDGSQVNAQGPTLLRSFAFLTTKCLQPVPFGIPRGLVHSSPPWDSKCVQNGRLLCKPRHLSIDRLRSSSIFVGALGCRLGHKSTMVVTV